MDGTLIIEVDYDPRTVPQPSQDEPRPNEVMDDEIAQAVFDVLRKWGVDYNPSSFKVDEG